MKYLFVPLRQRREHSHTRLRMVSPAQGQATARDFFISQTALDTCRKMCPPPAEDHRLDIDGTNGARESDTGNFINSRRGRRVGCQGSEE